MFEGPELLYINILRGKFLLRGKHDKYEVERYKNF